MRAEPRFTQQAVCVHLCSGKDLSAGSAKVVTTSFKGFFTHVLCGRNSTAVVEECNFSSCNNSSILTTNVGNLSVRDSVFDDCGESPIEVRFIEPIEKIMKREIIISGNSMSNSKGNGVIICSNEVADNAPGDASISVDRNTFSHLKRDGILLQNIAFHRELSITKNEVKQCGKNGIAVLCCYPEVLVARNAVAECKGTGVYVQRAVCSVRDCEVVQNGGCGVLLKDVDIVLASSKEHQVVITNSKIKDNKEDGIAIYNSKNLLALIEGNEIDTNWRNGVRIDANPISGASVDDTYEGVYRAAEKKIKSTGRIEIKDGQIIFNKKSGILVEDSYLIIDGPTIQANVSSALNIKGNYKKVKFTEKALKHRRIAGLVFNNGKFINIYNKPKSCCGNCNIF